MAKYKLNQLKDGDAYWTPEFADDVRMFETSYVYYDIGCWSDIVDGWAFDNEQECAELCRKLNEAIEAFKDRSKKD